MSYQTLLLDLDHTLFDTETSEIRAFDQTLTQAGIEKPFEHFEHYQNINITLWKQVEKGEIKAQDVRLARFERLVSESGLRADPESMAEDYVEQLGLHGELYAGARKVLDVLKQTRRLALVTNGLGEVQRARIKRLGIDQHFDALAISAEIGTAKPHRGIFDFVFDQLGQPDRQSALMVGDNLSADIRGGADYGIATCWFNPHGQTAGPEHSITHEVSCLTELPDLVPQE